MSAVPSAAPAAPDEPLTKLNVEEFVARYASVPGTELVKGVVKAAPVPSPKHGFVCSRIDRLIGNFIDEHDLGRVATNDSFVKTGPDTVRGGDVCFWGYERLPRGPVPEGLLSQAPDLVVEVRSPTDRWGDLFAKVGEYLNAGVRVVVVLSPVSGTASVYRPDELQQIFHNGDELTLPDVQPGFTVPVGRLFA